MDLFSNSSLGWAWSSCSAVQSHSKHQMRQSSPFSQQGPGSCSSIQKKPPGSPTGLRWGHRSDKLPAGTSKAVLGWVSLNGSNITSWAQQRYVKQINPWLWLVKTSEVEQTKAQRCGDIFILLHSGSFYVFAISKHPFTCVCFRKTFFSHVCLSKTSFHPCAPGKHYLTLQTNQVPTWKRYRQEGQ